MIDLTYNANGSHTHISNNQVILAAITVRNL